MTREEIEEIANAIEVEEGDLIVCPNCNGLHDARYAPLNGSGARMVIECDGKVISL